MIIASCIPAHPQGNPGLRFRTFRLYLNLVRSTQSHQFSEFPALYLRTPRPRSQRIINLEAEAKASTTGRIGVHLVIEWVVSTNHRAHVRCTSVDSHREYSPPPPPRYGRHYRHPDCKNTSTGRLAAVFTSTYRSSDNTAPVCCFPPRGRGVRALTPNRSALR